MDEELYDKLVILDEQFTKLLPLLHEKANKADAVPVGTILYLANNADGKPVIPKGYLYCDGSEISRTVYHQLFEAIGTVAGAGDGVTTFNIPDLRNMFIRGWDNRKAQDRFLGSVEQDAMRRITGEFGMLNSGSVQGAFTTSTETTPQKHMLQRTTSYGDTGIRFDNALVTNVANENRPINQAWIPVIKYINYIGTDATFYSDSNDLFVKGRVYSLSTQQGGVWPDRSEPVKGVVLTSYATVQQKVANNLNISFTNKEVLGSIKDYDNNQQTEIDFNDIAISIVTDDNGKRTMTFNLKSALHADTITLVYRNNWIPLVKSDDASYSFTSPDVIALFINKINEASEQLQFKTFFKEQQ